MCYHVFILKEFLLEIWFGDLFLKRFKTKKYYGNSFCIFCSIKLHTKQETLYEVVAQQEQQKKLRIILRLHWLLMQ